MDRLGIWNNVIAIRDTRASDSTCESTNPGVVVTLFVENRGELLGEAFSHLAELEPDQLARWVSALRNARLPGTGAE